MSNPLKEAINAAKAERQKQADSREDSIASEHDSMIEKKGADWQTNNHDSRFTDGSGVRTPVEKNDLIGSGPDNKLLEKHDSQIAKEHDIEIVSKRDSLEPEQHQAVECEPGSSSVDPLVGLNVRVPRSHRLHWVIAAKREETSLASVINALLAERFGLPEK